MATPQEPKGRPIRCMLSRRRYDALSQRLRDIGLAPDVAESVLAALRDVMNFDPLESTALCSRRHLEYVHRKAAELGTTTYVTSGHKALYERRRTAEGP